MPKSKKEYSLSRADRYNKKERNAGKIVIYTEGDVTEPEYLNDWIKGFAVKNGLNPLKVKTWFEIVPSDDESEPLKVVENLVSNENPKDNELDKFYACLMKMIEAIPEKIRKTIKRRFKQQKVTILM